MIRQAIAITSFYLLVIAVSAVCAHWHYESKHQKLMNSIQSDIDLINAQTEFINGKIDEANKIRHEQFGS